MQNDCEFESSLGYIARLSQENRARREGGRRGRRKKGKKEGGRERVRERKKDR
jgi:hypothetical protein